jgi:hypothetical protein
MYALNKIHLPKQSQHTNEIFLMLVRQDNFASSKFVMTVTSIQWDQQHKGALKQIWILCDNQHLHVHKIMAMLHDLTEMVPKTEV